MVDSRQEQQERRNRAVTINWKSTRYMIGKQERKRKNDLGL